MRKDHSTVAATSVTVPLSGHDPNKVYSEVIARQHVAQMQGVTVSDAGELTAWRFSLVMQIRMCHDPRKYQQHREELRGIIQRIVDFYARLYSTMHTREVFYNLDIILAQKFFPTPDEIKALGDECLTLISEWSKAADQPERNAEIKQELNRKKQQLNSQLFNLNFLCKIASQLAEQSVAEPWCAETLRQLTPKSVMALFYLKPVVDALGIFERLILHQNEPVLHGLLQKLSKQEVMTLLGYVPVIGSFLFGYLIRIAYIADQLTPDDIMQLVFPKRGKQITIQDSKKSLQLANDEIKGGFRIPEASHRAICSFILPNKFSIQVLSCSTTLTKLLTLTNKTYFLKLLAYVDFYFMQRTIVDPPIDHNRDEKIDTPLQSKSILEFIRPHMTESDWLNYLEQSTSSFNDRVLLVQDEQIYNLLSAETLAKLAIYDPSVLVPLLNHPGECDLYIMDKLPNWDDRKNYEFCYIFAETENKLYYLTYDGSWDDLTRQSREPYTSHLDMKAFRAQLDILKADRESATKIHLNATDIRKLIINNGGVLYPSAAIHRLTQACRKNRHPDSYVRAARLNSMWHTYTDYDDDRGQLDNSLRLKHYPISVIKSIKPPHLMYRAVTEDLMRYEGWDGTRCCRRRRYPSRLAAKPTEPQPSSVQTPTATPPTPIEHLPADTTEASAPQIRSPSAKQIVWGSGCALGCIGSIGMILIKTGASSTLGGPYLWPISLGLVCLGGFLLLGPWLHALYQRRMSIFAITSDNNRYDPSIADLAARYSS